MTGQIQANEVAEYGEVVGPEVISALRKSLLRVGDEEAAAFELFLRGIDIRGPCGDATVTPTSEK